MPTKSDILLAIVLPAVLAGILLAIAWRPRSRADTTDGRWAGGIAIGGAFALSYAKLVGLSGFPLQSQSQWIVYAIIVAVVLDIVDAILRPPTWVRLPIVLIVMAALVWLLINQLVPGSLMPTPARLWTTALAIASCLWWWGMETYAQRAPGVAAPLVLLVFAVGCAAITGMIDGLISQPMVAGATAAALGFAVAVAIWSRGRFSLARGGVFTAAVALIGLLIFGYFWAPDDEPAPKTMVAHALLFVAPLAAWAALAPGVRRLPPALRTAVAVLLVLVITGSAVALVASIKPPSSTESPEYNY